MSPNCRRTGLTAVAAVLLAGEARAQAAPPAEEQAPRFEEVVDVEAELPALPPASSVATGVPVSVMEVPASLSVVPRRLLDQQQAFVLNEASALLCSQIWRVDS